MTWYMRSVLAGTALALALGCLAGSTGAQDNQAAFKKFLPPGAYKELVTRTAKGIEADLAAGKDDQLERAQAQAVLIVGYARSAEAAAGSSAGVEGTASQLARIVTDKAKLPQARKMAAELAQLHGETGASDGILGKLSNIAELMNLLRPKGKGGEGLAAALQSNARLKGALNGVEEKIRALAKKALAGDRIGTESGELELLGYKLAVLGEITAVYKPDSKKGKGSAADWNRLSLAMRDESLHLAAAAGKKDAQATFKAANALNATCTDCHAAFR
jgi:hypothetical protein